MSFWLIGTGPHAIQYAKVLEGLAVDFKVIGRGLPSALKFEKIVKKKVTPGGVEHAIQTMPIPEACIISTSIPDLCSVAILMLASGCKKILLEKPGALNTSEINRIYLASLKTKAEIFIAYNRRYFSSVIAARQIIQNDGGVASFTFDFTEWPDTIENLEISSAVKQNWVLANSSHILDLAFHLGGIPKAINCNTSGALNWHKAGSRFSGSGQSESGALFSYIADWGSPGRWSVELMTKNYRLILRPIEEVKIMKKGSVTVSEFLVNNELDINFKPGLYLQVKAFISNDYTHLCSIKEQIKNAEIYNQIAGYK